MTRHAWFADAEPRRCQSCGKHDCTGRIAVDFCPLWAEAAARNARGEYLPTVPVYPGTVFELRGGPLGEIDDDS